jgi:hypothetical protein
MSLPLGACILPGPGRAAPEGEQLALLFGRRELCRRKRRKDLVRRFEALAFLEALTHGSRDVRRETHAFGVRCILGKAQLVSPYCNADLLRCCHRHDDTMGG